MTPGTSPADPRVARSRARLLAAATDLLVESGPSAVTVDAVAERSGVAKSTLYRHWPSRTDLLFDVVRAHMPQVPTVDPAAGFDEALRALLRGIATTMGAPCWAHILPPLLALQHHTPELAALVAADRDCRLAVLGEVLDLGAAEGRFRRPPDRARVAQLLIGPLVFAILTGDDVDLVELADETAEHYLAALRGL
jgi:AcrR family transcriptional regulator